MFHNQNHFRLFDSHCPVFNLQLSIAISRCVPQPKTFLIYNSAQGLGSKYCQDPSCSSYTKQTLKCDAKLYSSALISINYESQKWSQCTKSFKEKGTDKTLYCTYYIVIGYGSLTSQSSSKVSFIVCYDRECNTKYLEETIIDTSFDLNSNKPMGYSLSLSTYSDAASGNQYPMFTYSKYSATLKQFVLNVIICLDFHCSTWIGKSMSSFASNPPYLTLGKLPIITLQLTHKFTEKQSSNPMSNFFKVSNQAETILWQKALYLFKKHGAMKRISFQSCLPKM